MELYAAPLDGVTGYVWRKAHAKIFGGADKYYTPFIAPNMHMNFSARELRDISQGEENLVPQILTFNAGHFIWAAREMQALGYSEVNLNLGCPSGTVVAKDKGSGALRDPIRLDYFLDSIFEALPDMKISIKTRTGLLSEDEWPLLISVFERYPVYQLTIHPRLRIQQYKGLANRELFKEARKKSSLKLVYNGDVKTAGDEAFSWDCPVMAGRGLAADPALFRKARAGGAAEKSAGREEFLEFHDLLIEGYQSYMSGEVPLIHRLKELWSYMLQSFAADPAAAKKLMKAKSFTEYSMAAGEILRNAELKNPDS